MNDHETKTPAPKIIEGLDPIDPALLEEFKRAMNEEAIPKILKMVEERKLKAAETLQWPLKN